MGAAPLLGGVRRQLAPVYGEVFLADQAELGGVQQHVTEQTDDLAVKLADEGGQRREVGPCIGRKSPKYHVAPASFGQRAAGDDALVVAIQHDLQQDFRVVRQASRGVVGVALLEHRQIEMLLDDLVERV